MRKYSLVVSAIVLSLSISALGQTGKITKAKGGKAVVDFGSSVVKEGQQVMISDGDDMDLGASKSSAGGERGRQHGLAYGLTYTSRSVSGSNSSSMGLSADYLYNLGSFEVGGMLTLATADPGSVSSTGFGAQGRYNFTENKKGKTLIPYVGLGLLMESTNPGSAKATTMFGTGGVNWFPWGQIFAVDAALKFGSVSTEVGSAKATASTLGVSAGWRVYF